MSQQQEKRDRLSAAMKRNAEARKCPKCERKGATSTTLVKHLLRHSCRWCDWHRVFNLETSEEVQP